MKLTEWMAGRAREADAARIVRGQLDTLGLDDDPVAFITFEEGTAAFHAHAAMRLGLVTVDSKIGQLDVTASAKLTPWRWVGAVSVCLDSRADGDTITLGFGDETIAATMRLRGPALALGLACIDATAPQPTSAPDPR